MTGFHNISQPPPPLKFTVIKKYDIALVYSIYDPSLIQPKVDWHKDLQDLSKMDAKLMVKYVTLRYSIEIKKRKGR